MTSFRMGRIFVWFLIICLILDVTRHLEQHPGQSQCTINIDGKRTGSWKGEREVGEACLDLSLCILDLEMLITMAGH